MDLYFALKDSQYLFNKKILAAIKNTLAPVIQQAGENSLLKISDIVIDSIKNTNEIQSITDPHGTLRLILGFSNPKLFVDDVLNSIKHDIIIRYIPLKVINNKEISGGLSVEIIKGDYSTLLSSHRASYTSNNIEIPWLRWLLFEGQNILIQDYTVEFGNFPRNRSRTGQAVMRNDPGGGFQIPPQFAGTENDNFISRTLSNESIITRITNHIKLNIYRLL